MTTTLRSTTADRIRWQQRALREMTAAIQTGAKAKLEPLMWQLGASGSVGRVSTLGLTVGEQEALLREWARVLGFRVYRPTGTTLSACEPRGDRPDYWQPPIRVTVELYDWDRA